MAGDSRNSTSLQECEIAGIKASYEGQVRVISGIGDFTNVLTIHPDGLDLHCKFQLTEKYPHSPPTISIRSSVLNADQTASLTSILQNEADTRLGHVMLADLMAVCKSWLLDNDVDVSAKVVVEKTKKNKKNGKSKQENKSEKPVSENESGKSGKKPPMRTAADVIKRLQWDNAFNKEDFIVGYIDRIIGLVEKNFTAFTWEDLASVDVYSLAIPQHRIQYFKYKTEKVWDKTTRLDNVFGSTGSKLTLVDAVQKYEDKLKDLNGGETGDGEKRALNADVDDHGDEEFDGVSAEETYEFDSDEDISEPTDEHSKDIEAGSSRRKRPNYFVALQITDQETVEKLVEAQKQIMTWYPVYSDHKISANAFHLTLAVMNLDSLAEKQTCVEAMARAQVAIEHLAKETPPLVFQGLDHFNRRVIYAKVKFSQKFLALVDTIRNVLEEAGFRMEERCFNPHLSLFNVKRSAKLEKECLLLTSFDDKNFGSQSIDNIQVCRMGTLPEEGFYENIYKMNITHSN